MNQSTDWLSLRHAYSVCSVHHAALREALGDLAQLGLTAGELGDLSKDDRRLLDQFAYRYTRLQDDMGAMLIPAILRALGEEISALPVLDRLNRLEQLGWLPDAEQWLDLRRFHNEFSHEYPDTIEEHFERLHLAIASAQTTTEFYVFLSEKIRERFAGMEL